MKAFTYGSKEIKTDRKDIYIYNKPQKGDNTIAIGISSDGAGNDDFLISSDILAFNSWHPNSH